MGYVGVKVELGTTEAAVDKYNYWKADEDNFCLHTQKTIKFCLFGFSSFQAKQPR